MSKQTKFTFSTPGVVHTYFTSEVGIILVGLAYIVVSGCKAAVTEVVRIVTAEKIYSTGIGSSVVVV